MSKASAERRAKNRVGLGQRPIDMSARGARAQQDVPMYFRAGLEFLERNETQQAERFFRSALDLMPDRPRAPLIRAKVHHNLGLCIMGRADYAGAMEQFEIAKRLDPAFRDTRVAALLPLLYSDRISARDLFAEHKEAGALAEKEITPQESHPNSPDPTRKLKIGYVSGDFLAHSVMSFFEPLLKNHDRSAFEITCYFESGKDYGAGPRGDAMTEWVRSNADRFRMFQAVPPADLAWQIGADEIDILIDLSGHTAHNRLDVFARRPAPVQMTGLGYAHSTGLTRIQYRWVDWVTDPEGADALATENLYRIPKGCWCYQPRPAAPLVAPPPSASGAPITFGSFNFHQKLSRRALNLWGQVLRAVPDSRLILKSFGLDVPEVAQRLKRVAAEEGIDMARVEVLMPEADFAAHMALYAKVDIALDPFPYNGTTSSAEALWQGLPLVTLAGNRHAARVGASILHQLGLDELVADDRAAYVDIAAKLASDPARLLALRSGMRERMLASPFCDAPGFAKRFEVMLRDVWSRYCAQQTGDDSPVNHGTAP